MAKKINKFISKCKFTFVDLIQNDFENEKVILKIYHELIKVNNNNNIHIFGNGGSASISNHFSLDLNNNSNLKCYNYNDPALITCFANDFGYANWISKSINKFGKKGDLLIAISSKGESKNMINSIKEAKKKKFKSIITLTGFNKNNSLRKKGDINLWVNSSVYNIVENIHQFYLLLLVDMIKIFQKK